MKLIHWSLVAAESLAYVTEVGSSGEEVREGNATLSFTGSSSSSSSSLSRCPSTCRRRRSGKCAIGVQSLWNHSSLFGRPQGCEPWDVHLTQREGEGRLNLFLGSGINTHKEYYFCPPSFLRWQRVGRKEGREGKRERGGVEMNSLRLKELSNSDLYRRRQERPDSYGSLAGERFRWAFSRLSVKIIDAGTNVGSVQCLFVSVLLVFCFALGCPPGVCTLWSFSICTWNKMRRRFLMGLLSKKKFTLLVGSLRINKKKQEPVL